ncbi:MFS general substrate transporter [Artomyces pyxidatus]|uniref:MFS general substrate transporter n=1 Tax=Artomyces pyxidatus TaxID=48021 RepID=A0ACB8SKG9_9AGAM|nr:MFS general substrate transporter [Artomyces pyxidatus]
MSSPADDSTFSVDDKNDASSISIDEIEDGLATPVDNPSPVMDGGAQAWCTLVGAFLTAFCTFGYANAFGVFQDYYTRSHAASASHISWIGSTQVFLLIAMGLPSGKLLDMGYFRQTVFTGSCIFVFSLFMASLAHPDKYYQIFLSQGVGVGIGTGLLHIPAMAVQAHHWRTKRTLAMGVVISGSSLGGVMLPIMLNHLLSSSVGFAWGVRASAFLVLGVLIAANLLMTPRPSISANKAPKADVKSLLLDLPYMLMVLAILAGFLGVYFPYFYLQLFSVLNGMDAKIAFYTLSIMNAASIPGRILPNLFANRIGVYNMLIVVTTACAVLILALLGVASITSTMIFAILYGFFSGSFLSLLAPALGSLARHDGEIGTRIGLAFFLASPGALLGQPIDGALLGSTFPWNKPVVFSAVCSI